MRVTYVYDIVTQKEKITGICGICKKKKSRIIKAQQTINPFNKNNDGTVKNKHDVIMSVKEELKEKIDKLKQKYVCYSCYDNLSYEEKINWNRNK